MDCLLTLNAFRVLSLTADAESKDVYRQRQRLQNAIELGELPKASLTFLPQLTLSIEALLDAVHRIEKQRLLEELFWIHNLGGKLDLQFSTSDAAVLSLRTEAGQNTTKGAVAQHNLAVVLTSLARELSGARRFDYWADALVVWERTLTNDTFWQFMQDRADFVTSASSTNLIEELRLRTKNVVQTAVVEEIGSAIDRRDYKAITALAQLVETHKIVFDGDVSLSAVVNRIINDGSVAIGSVLDRIGDISEQTDAAIIRKTLTTAEEDVRRIFNELGSTVRALRHMVGIFGWSDTQATALEKLSIAYFNRLDDQKEALQLLVEAQTLAHDPEIRGRLERDWKHLQRAIMCSEGIALLKAGEYQAAEQKFASAWSMSSEDQKAEIEELQNSSRRARVFHDVDTSKRSPGLFTLNGIGATFYGKRDFDSETSTYVTTHWFVLFFLPIIPMSAYRVSHAGGNSYHIFGRVPLSPFLKKYRWVPLFAIVALIVVANINTNSSSVTTPSYNSSAPSSTSEEPRAQGDASGPSVGTNAGYSSRLLEKQAIEAERSELERVSAALDFRKRQIDDEGAALDQMESYIREVKSSYTSETIPEGVRVKYNSTVDDYNNRVPGYNQTLEAFKSDIRNYQQRLAAFNARVDRYNSNQ